MGGRGVSGTVIIQESHLTLHTWPEYGFASVGLFTCGESVNPWAAFDFPYDKLKAGRTETTEIPRGLADKIIRLSGGEFAEIKLKIYFNNKGLEGILWNSGLQKSIPAM